MMIPKTLRWKFVRTLGEGGHGVVALVIDPTEERSIQYALKSLKPGKSKTAYERFANEINTIKSINHPGIVRIIDHSLPESDFQYYVMEFHQGAKPLKKLLETTENPFSGDPLKSLDFFIQIVSALEACENQKIIHRDLSPANILVLPDGKIKLIDFGLCQVEGSERITLTGEGIGTPNYMAPECESGSSGAVDSRTDLYSAGKLLWSAITNRIAFSREKAVFDHSSMKNLFPRIPSIWHLHHIFEITIRHEVADRAENCRYALDFANNVEQVIRSGALPLELLDQLCPSCQWGNLRPFEQSHSVFGNPNPPGIGAVQCSYCGHCFAIDFAQLRKRLAARKSLS